MRFPCQAHPPQVPSGNVCATARTYHAVVLACGSVSSCISNLPPRISSPMWKGTVFIHRTDIVLGRRDG